MASSHRFSSVRALAAFLLLLAPAVVALPALPARATITHQVFLGFDEAYDPVTYDLDTSGDRITGATGADIDRALLASISGSGYSAVGSVGEFGALGVSGNYFRPGGIHAQVFIEDSEIRNPFSQPLRAEANFIVDGGRLNLIAGSNDPANPAFIQLVLTVTSRVTGSFSEVFQSIIEVTSTDFSTLSLSTRGADLGAFQVPNSTEIEIPFSFQSLDLGVIPVGGSVDIEYQLDITTGAEIAEGIFFEFSDPLDVTGDGPFSVTFLGVPEPGSGLLLAGALTWLAGATGLIRRRAN